MKKQQPKDISVKVKRAFRIGGHEVQAGEVINLEYRFALELIGSGKVERTNESPAAKAEPAAPAPAKAAPKSPERQASQPAANKSPVAPAKGE